MVATEILEAFRNGRFGQLPLTNRDEHGRQAAHHVVTERRRSNGELQSWRMVRSESPVVGQSLPSCVDDAAQYRYIRVRVRRATTKGAKVVQAEYLGAHPVHRVDVQWTLHRPRPRVREI